MSKTIHFKLLKSSHYYYPTEMNTESHKYNIKIALFQLQWGQVERPTCTVSSASFPHKSLYYTSTENHFENFGSTGKSNSPCVTLQCGSGTTWNPQELIMGICVREWSICKCDINRTDRVSTISPGPELFHCMKLVQ